MKVPPPLLCCGPVLRVEGLEEGLGEVLRRVHASGRL